jgi:nucleoside-diphosphate-sugar epimerase
MILITGSNTLQGAELVKKLSQKGEKIKCYDYYKPVDLPDGVEFIQGDLFNLKQMNRACKGADTVIHLLDKQRYKKAGRGKMRKINIKGTYNLLVCARRAKVKRFIFQSTYAVYGKTKSFPVKENDIKKPCTPYGRDKLRAEALCESFCKKNKISWSILRPALITGPETNNPSILISLYMAMAMDDDNIMYLAGDGDTHFQLISPEDTAEALYRIYKSNDKANEHIFNAGSDNVPTQMEQIVKIKEKEKLDFSIKHITPLKARFYSILFKPSKINFFTKDHRFYMFNSMYMDCQKLKEATGWEPKKDNIKILSETIEWYRGKIS